METLSLRMRVRRERERAQLGRGGAGEEGNSEFESGGVNLVTANQGEKGRRKRDEVFLGRVGTF